MENSDLEDEKTLHDRYYAYHKEFLSSPKVLISSQPNHDNRSNEYDSLFSNTFSSNQETRRPFTEDFRANSLLHHRRRTSPYFLGKSHEDLESLRGYIHVRFRRNIEKVELYTDDYCFLEFRKAFARISHGYSEFCFIIIKSKVFESLVISVIIMNTILLALEDPNNPASVYLSIENFFLYFYTVECALKVSATGLILNKASYLRDRWNIMDFIILITAWISVEASSGVKLSVLRMLRILRPLRSISSIRGIRALFLALFHSFQPLLSAFVVLFFFLLIFAIAGLQLWSGTLTQRCISIDTGIMYDDKPCGVLNCPQGYDCGLSLDNPNKGATSFDNIFISFITVFQIITLEGWTQVLQLNQQSFSYYSILYYIPLVFIGANLLINLSLAIITSSFTDAVHHINDEISEVVSLDFLDKDEIVAEKPVQTFDGEVNKKKLLKLKSKNIKPIVRNNYSGEWMMEVEENEDEYDEDSWVENARGEENKSPLSISENGGMQGQDKANKNSKIELFSRRINSNKKERLLEDCSLRVKSEFVTARSTLKRIKSVLTLIKDKSADSIDNITKNNENYIPHISEHYKLLVDSYEDVLTVERIVKENSIYSFYYTISDEICSIEHLLDKYSASSLIDLQKTISTIYSSKRAYELIKTRVKDHVKNVLKEDQRNKCIQGEWSGLDINSNSDASISLIAIYDSYSLWPSGYKSYIQQFRYITRIFILHHYTINFITFIVIFNTITLSIDHYGISNEESQTLSLINTICTYIFVGELVIKLIGIDLKELLRDKMNYFDAVVVILSIVELMILSGNTSAFSAFRAIRVFRVFRVLRVMRLLRYLKSMTHIMKGINKSLSNFLYLFFLLALLLIIFSLIGMKVFGGQFNFPEGLPRANFDTFNWAFITTFQVLSTENWDDVLTSSLRSQAGPFSCIFLIAWVILGNFIFLNLFLAVLIESFSETSYEESHEGFISPQAKIYAKIKQKFGKSLKKLEEFESENTSFVDEYDFRTVATADKSDFFDSYQCGKSYNIFGKDSKLRKLCYNSVSHPRFDSLILVIIIASSLKLVWDTYTLDSVDTTQLLISHICDYLFTIIFFIEFLMKSISMGFMLNQKSYLKDNWNRLDFSIVVASIIDISVSSVNIPIIKVFRILRTLRPLKLINHNISMKIMVIALIESLRAILNVVVVILVIWLVFSILGVSLLGGKMYSCQNRNITIQDQCEAEGYRWVNVNSNFDNVFQAMMTLFIVMSQESWPNRMHEGVDAVDVGISPRVNANPPMAYFYIVYFIIGNFFLVNLFTAVIFEKFTKAKKDQSSMAALILSKEQMLWAELQKMILRSKPVVEASQAPKNKIRALFFHMSKSKAFEVFMMIVILINMIVLASPYVGASQAYLLTVENINMALTCVFIFEAFIKLTGLGPLLYFKNHWNQFDFFVVVTSSVDLILEFSIGSNVKFLRSFPQLIRVIRVMRIARVLRLVKNLKSLQDIIAIITYAMPALLNILSLLLLVFYIFAVLGSFLFHSIKKGEISINDYYNFSNFGYSMVILWRMSTGEDYENIMYDCAHALNTEFVYIYFCVFITLTDFVVLELFVSVLIQNYEEQTKNDDTAMQIFNKEIKRFRREWSYYSFKSIGVYVEKEDILKFMKNFGVDFGVLCANPTKMEVVKLLGGLDIKCAGEKYYYNDVLFALMKRKYGKKANPLKESLNSKLLRIQELKSHKSLDKIREKSKLSFNMHQRESSSDKVFYNIMIMKNIFSKWKQYTKRNKNLSDISITPRYSDDDYPGDNSEISSHSLPGVINFTK